MSEHTISHRHGVRTLTCGPDGPKLAGEGDALELVGQALQHHVDLVVVAAERFDDRFFALGTGIAGEIIQKLVTYRLRLAIVGDIDRHLSKSSALRAFVVEANRGRDVWFVADLGELDARLQRTGRLSPRTNG